MQGDLVFGIAEEDHLLPFDLTERIILDDHDLDGQLVLDRGDEIAHQHREAAVADERDHLAIGIGRLSPDRIREPGRHGRQVARAGEFHPAAHVDMTRGPGRDRPRVGRDDGIIAEQIIHVPGDNLGFDRRLVPVLSSPHQLIPLSHALLGLLEERAILLRVQEGQELLQGRLGVSDHADFHRVAQADASGIDVELDGPGLIRLGIPLEVREARTDQEQPLALFHGLFGGPGS